MIALLLLALVSSSGVATLEGEMVELEGGEQVLSAEGVKRAKFETAGGTYEVSKSNQSCGGFTVILLALKKGEMSLDSWEASCHPDGAHVKVKIKGGCNASLQAFRGERRLDDLSIATAVRSDCEGGSLRASPLLWNTLLLSTKDRWVVLRFFRQGEELIVAYGVVLREAQDFPIASPIPVEEADRVEREGEQGKEIDYFKLIALLILLGIVAVLELALGRESYRGH
ncbi:MAG: hypothetical protein NZ902_01490 [Acidilobaceae archaeon]|nr:hypothetical protein [Acidilobaceae archaeon]MDW7973924.1 hypothetical protein [Sulfolobales archaeon]